MTNLQRFIDLTGRKFGKFTVLSRDYTKISPTSWLCRCDCGKERIVIGTNLTRGRHLSCGCTRTPRPSNGRYYKSKNRAYSIWRHMIDRVCNPKHIHFKNYGGRGITVCDEWRIFENFHKDMGDPTSKTHTLERTENDKGYCKDNCKWATPKEQGNNKRNSVQIEYNGVKMNRQDLAKELGIPNTSLCRYLSKGYSIEKIVKHLQTGEMGMGRRKPIKIDV